MTFSEHALQVHALLHAFAAALRGRIADIDHGSLASGPDALAGRVIAQIFEDGIGVIGHFAAQIEINLAALGLDLPSALPSPPPVQQPGDQGIGNQEIGNQEIDAARGSKLLDIEAKRALLLSAYTAQELTAWRAYPGRVFGAASGTLPDLTQDEQDEFARLARIDLIEAHAAGLRARAGVAGSEAELEQIVVADGWP